jgi:hypothetical protein
LALISRLLARRIFRFGFVALALAFAAWYIVGHVTSAAGQEPLAAREN